MKKKLKRLAAVAALLLAVLVCTALYLRPDWRYLCADAVARQSVSAPLERQDEHTLELTAFTADELTAAGVNWDRSLMLINDEHHLPSDYKPQLIDYHDTGVLMDEAMAADFEALSQVVQERFGETLLVRSSYRTRQEQAETIVQDGDVAAALDASEHQAGLALDVYVPGYAGRAFLKTEAGQYVNDHCWEYGFIIRYPYYGTSSTGIGYEPWHLRYVGRPHAQIMMENSWTLEEYQARLEPGTFWQFGDAVITRQTEAPYLLPSGAELVTASPDNQGGVIFTVTMQ